MDDFNNKHPLLKLAIAWIGASFGTLTLNQWVLVATLIYTIIQIVIGLRKLWNGK